MILAWLSAAFLSGVLAGYWISLPWPLPVALACVLVAAAYLARRTRRWSLLLILAAALFGLSRSPPSGGPPSSGDLRFYNGQYMTVHGVISAEPDVRDTGINYDVTADSITAHGHARQVSGKLRLHTPRSQILDYGEIVSLTGRLLTPTQGRTVPYRDILARQGIRSEMRFVRVLDLGPSQPSWLSWIVPLRQHIEDGINAWLPEPEAALLIAITLGAHSASLGDLTQILIATGLIHIIAISGIKVAMVAGTMYALVRPLRNRFLALVLTLSVLALYVLLTGATASGERSALMWTMVFVAEYLGRGTVPVVSLSFVVALMVGLDPSLPLDIGFQMSALGTLAIVIHAPWLLRALWFVPSPIREALGVTVAAQVGTLPVVIVGFHVVSLTGPLANALALPLLPLLIALGFLLGVCSGVAALAAPIAAFAYGLLEAVTSIATELAKLPGAIPAGAESAPVTALYYAALAGASALVIRRMGWAPLRPLKPHWREVAIALIGGASVLTVSVSRAESEPHARLTSLGSGHAILLRSEGMTALIDGSSRPLGLLQQLGKTLPYQARTIDLVVVTDPRSSNILGLEGVLAHYGVSEVVDVGAEYPSTTYARWRAELRSRHIPTYTLRTGVSTRIGAVVLTALGPDALYPRPQDCAGLLRLSLDTRSFLFAGSASAREQREAVFRSVNLRASTLMVDNGQQLDQVFLGVVRPETLIGASIPTHVGRLVYLPSGRFSSMDL